MISVNTGSTVAFNGFDLRQSAGRQFRHRAPIRRLAVPGPGMAAMSRILASSERQSRRA